MNRALLLASVLAFSGCSDPAPGVTETKDATTAKTDPGKPPRMPGGNAIGHTLRFPAPHTHYVEVESVFPAAGESLEIMMAVWSPGSYLVREYAQHVVDLRVTTADGDPLAFEKTRKNRWRITTGGAKHVVVRYRLYAYNLSVRANFVDADIAIINGAPTFFTIVDDLARAHDVVIRPAAAWKTVATALPAHPSGQEQRYLAPNFDVLVDSPIVIGNPEQSTFEVDGVPHVLATFGGTDVWDQDKAAADLKKVVTEATELWGVIPYEDYVFLNLAMDRYGGLEHKASTLMLIPRFATLTRDHHLGWLGLASHEFFHTWNVKRLRPKALGPFDYENENYTRSLWIAEGITSYYDDLLVERAGLMTQKEYLEKLSKQIERLETRPGRKRQPLSRSSFDAWIEHYRPDENSRNTSVSYYTKGAVVGFLLDAKIREASGGKKSLDDVMRAAYEAFSGEHGYTPEEFVAVCERVSGTELDDFFAKYVDGTAELNYDPALAYFGLEFSPVKKDDEDKDEDAAGWLGVRLEARGESASVTSIDRDTPAFEAGLNVGDEILAIEGYRVTMDNLDSRLKAYGPGSEVAVLVSRRGRLTTIAVTLGTEPVESYELAVRKRSSSSQNGRRRSWLR